MYAVIFRAEIAQLDAEYAEMAAEMRDIALNRYGCQAFHACAENGWEIAVSYWESAAQIKAWRENDRHRLAQDKGRNRWYKSYTVEVVEIVREYASPPASG